MYFLVYYCYKLFGPHFYFLLFIMLHIAMHIIFVYT